MNFDCKHVAKLALAIFLLGIEPGFSDPALDGNPGQPLPTFLRPKVSLTSDFNSLLASAGKGDADAQEQVGAAYCDGVGVAQDYHQGLIWLQKAADQNNTRAISWLGLIYANGFGVPPDQTKAFQYYLAAATAGNDPSDEMQVAERYARGNGVSPSDVESLSWNAKAAAQGNAQAQLETGLDYFNGKGSTRNPEKAFGYFLQASHRDVARAQYYMAYFYWNGIFVQRDPVQAYKWIELATIRDQEDDATALRHEVTSSLTPEQADKGEALLDDWPRERRGLGSMAPLHATFKSGTSATMPFENIDGEIVIATTINDHDKVKLMLDTGAAASLIDGMSVSQYQIPRSSTYDSLAGIGKQVVLGNHTDDLSLALPGLTFDHVSMNIAPCMPRIDGILGYDILGNYVIKIDYIAKTVEFMSPENFNAADAGQLLPCTLSRSKIYVKAKLNNSHSESDSADFVLDTGCSGGFVLSQHFTLSYPNLAFSKGMEGEAEGVGGSIWQEKVFCFGAQLGDILLKEPYVSVVKQDQGLFIHQSGLIGNEVWKNFELTIDYPGKKVYLKPNANFVESPPPAPVATEAKPRGPD